MRMFHTMLLAAAFLSAPASATVVIDFQSLETPAGIHVHGPSYSEDGFTVTAQDGGQLWRFGTSSAWYSGSTAVFNEVAGAGTILTRDGGGTFDLLSVDLAAIFPEGPFDVTFTGDLFGGGTVSQTFSLNGVNSLAQNFQFTGFEDLTSVKWIEIYPGFQFDNFVVDFAVNAVPEPATWLMMIMGFGMAGIVSRRRSDALAA